MNDPKTLTRAAVERWLRHYNGLRRGVDNPMGALCHTALAAMDEAAIARASATVMHDTLQAEVKRLAAELAEARATVAAEQGNPIPSGCSDE